MSFESFPNKNKMEGHGHEEEPVDDLDLANSLSGSTSAIPQVGVFFPQEAANDPIYHDDTPIPSMNWPGGVPYVDAQEEIVIGGMDGDFALDTQERADIQASIAAAKQQEAQEVNPNKTGFFGRLRRWFANEKQDDRTLEEILSEQGIVQKPERTVTRAFSGEMIDVDPSLTDDVILDETSLPKGSLNERDRHQIEALQAVAALHEEKPAVEKGNFWSRVKGWFVGEKADDRTLEERLAETGNEKALIQIRRKLALDPTSLKPDEILMLNDKEEKYYLDYLSKLEIEKRSKLRTAEHKLSFDPASLTEDEIELFNPNQKAYYDRWKSEQA
jgi:hypothetical protein